MTRCRLDSPESVWSLPSKGSTNGASGTNSVKKSSRRPVEWCKSCPRHELCRSICPELFRYLNGAFHARHSVSHLNETDYAALVEPGFSLNEVEGEGSRPKRGLFMATRRREG
jgi:hypothetical protein